MSEYLCPKCNITPAICKCVGNSRTRARKVKLLEWRRKRLKENFKPEKPWCVSCGNTLQKDEKGVCEICLESEFNQPEVKI